MSGAELTEEEVVQAIYKFAATQMRDGVPNTEVRQSLVDEGLDEESAAVVVSNLAQMKSEAMALAGKKNMAFGALWFIGGSVVTAATYGAASSNPNGGSYVVAWGAIVFGTLQFLRGLMQFAATIGTAGRKGEGSPNAGQNRPGSRLERLGKSSRGSGSARNEPGSRLDRLRTGAPRNEGEKQ